MSDLKYKKANAQEILDRLAGIIRNKGGADSSDEENDLNSRNRKKKRYGSKSPEDNQYVRYRQISENIVLFS